MRVVFIWELSWQNNLNTTFLTFFQKLFLIKRKHKLNFIILLKQESLASGFWWRAEDVAGMYFQYTTISICLAATHNSSFQAEGVLKEFSFYFIFFSHDVYPLWLSQNWPLLFKEIILKVCPHSVYRTVSRYGQIINTKQIFRILQITASTTFRSTDTSVPIS